MGTASDKTSVSATKTSVSATKTSVSATKVSRPSEPPAPPPGAIPEPPKTIKPWQRGVGLAILLVAIAFGAMFVLDALKRGPAQHVDPDSFVPDDDDDETKPHHKFPTAPQ